MIDDTMTLAGVSGNLIQWLGRAVYWETWFHFGSGMFAWRGINLWLIVIFFPRSFQLSVTNSKHPGTPRTSLSPNSPSTQVWLQSMFPWGQMYQHQRWFSVWVLPWRLHRKWNHLFRCWWGKSSIRLIRRSLSILLTHQSREKVSRMTKGWLRNPSRLHE